MVLSDIATIVEYSAKGAAWLKQKWNKHQIKKRLTEAEGLGLVVVLEVGREITTDVEEQLGEVFATISAIRKIEPHEFPIFAKQAYEKLVEARRFARKTLNENIPITLVTSGPVAMNFQLGQLVGLDHMDIELYQWASGEYVCIPNVTR